MTGWELFGALLFGLLAGVGKDGFAAFLSWVFPPERPQSPYTPDDGYGV